MPQTSTAVLTSAAKSDADARTERCTQLIGQHRDGDWSEHTCVRAFAVPFISAYTSGTVCQYTLRMQVRDDQGNVLTVELPCEKGESQSASPSAPTVLQGPANTSVAVGSSVTLTITAVASSAIQYRWYKSVGTNDRVQIPGATSSKYVISSAKLVDAGTYTAVASCSTGDSEASAVLSVTAS